MLTNLMFETIGATTYRLSLRRVQQPLARQVLKILTRDESFHIPLNVHFIRSMLERHPGRSRFRLRLMYQAVFHSLVLMSYGSRKVSQDFDQVTSKELTTAYVENLGRLFAHEADLDFRPPRHLLRAFGISDEAAEKAAQREALEVTAL